MIAGYAGRPSGSKDTEQRKRAKSNPVQTEKRVQKKAAKQQAAVVQQRSVNNERVAGFVGRIVQVSSARQSIHADTCAFADQRHQELQGAQKVQLTSERTPALHDSWSVVTGDDRRACQVAAQLIPLRRSIRSLTFRCPWASAT
jgi:hypothetical protein